MKSVFNFVYPVVLALLSAVVVLTARPGQAQADTYYTRKAVLKSFFPKSEAVSFLTYTPTPGERKTLASRLGQKLTRKSYYFYVARTRGHLDGYAFIGNQRGQHKPITFAVKLSPDGVILRHEVMAYRETWGSGIRDPRFRRQFVGKSVPDALRTALDITAISGATISSNSMAAGVRRALVLFELAVRRPMRSAARTSGTSGAAAVR